MREGVLSAGGRCSVIKKDVDREKEKEKEREGEGRGIKANGDIASETVRNRETS